MKQPRNGVSGGAAVIAAAVLMSLSPPLCLCAAAPPLDLSPADPGQATAAVHITPTVMLPDGRLETYFRRGLNGGITFFASQSADNGRTWGEPQVLTHLDSAGWGGPMPLLEPDGELQFVIAMGRPGNGRKIAVDRFIDLWHMRSTHGRTKWTQPQRIYEGYCGSLQGVYRLKSGRIVVPFADWLPGVPTTPPTGPEVTTCVYSDDRGATWKSSPSKLISPCHEGYNGANYGACEPTLVELKDGRVWMLIRTQDDRLYESYSSDGVNWEPAKPSRFRSSNSPAYQLRLLDGRLVVLWNNALPCPREDGAGVYSGRDALHAAISDDEGKTWRGFREVYRDTIRNESPPKSGDRGTAYPHATVTKDGKFVMVSGQGATRRKRFLIDPEWLLETSQSETFANADAWHLYKSFGKPAGWWRDRVQGPPLISHPDKPDAKVLHLRKPDERDADGAVWNFPAALKGELTLRIKLQKGGAGARISLADFLLDPCDPTAASRSAFTLAISGDGKLADQAVLTPGEWHTVKFAWDAPAGNCAFTVDDQAAATLKAQSPAPDGLSYLRLRSTAQAVDAAGFLVESVQMQAK